MLQPRCERAATGAFEDRDGAFERDEIMKRKGRGGRLPGNFKFEI
ncbi:MAG TPA: hypothetical protein VF703_05015 [Pyrinomonadaceae bacterium]|jgi:hypothetical protein